MQIRKVMNSLFFLLLVIFVVGFYAPEPVERVFFAEILIRTVSFF